MAILFYSSPRAQFFDGNGNPLSMGQVSYYFPGTTTLKEIYTDNTEATPAQNPQPLDAEGYVRDGGVWLGDGLYDVLLEASDGAGGFTTEWTMPNVGNIDSTPSGSVGNVAYVETINDLINVDTSTYSAVYVFGYYAKGDGGNGWFHFDAASVLAEDGGAVIAPLGAPATGRWLRIFTDDKISCTKWGATENAPGSVNSNLTNWTNYANSLDAECTMHIPPGIYTVVPGSLTVQQSIHIDNGVTFNVDGPGAYNFAINSRFEINTLSKITDASSQGSCNLDFTANVFGTSDLEVRTEWYETVPLTFDYSGSLYVLITSPVVASLAGAKTASLRFRETGSIDVSGNTLTVPKLDVGDPTVQRFTHGLLLPNPPLSFGVGTTIYTANFASLLQMAECTLTGTVIQVNNYASVINGQTIDISAAVSLISNGFAVEVNAGGTLLVPNRLGNLSVYSNGGLITNPGSIYDRYAFIISNQTQFDGYVTCALQNSNRVDFKDFDTTYNLDLTGVANSTIRNLHTTGGITADGEVRLVNSSLGGVHSAASATLVFLDSTLSTDLTCNLFRAKNTEIQGIVTAPLMDVDFCTISGELVPTAGAGNFDFDIRNSQFNGGYIKPNGSALSNKAYIIGNDFQFPAAENPATFLYVPIDGTNFTVTGETFVDNSVTFNVAYNVLVADNTPMWRDHRTPPTVGTKLLQTRVEGTVVAPGNSQPNIFNIDSSRLLLPFIGIDQAYAEFNASFLANPGALSTVRTAVRPSNTIELISGSDYKIELNPIFETGAGSSVSTEYGGFSYTLDMYPQRGL